ncbi:MAG: hypothetical protein ACOYOE_02525 [Chlorobium sp.]
MSAIRRDDASPDKYDIFIQKIDYFQSLVEEKRNLQTEISQIRNEFNEKIKPLEDGLSTIIRKLEANLSRLEGSAPAQSSAHKFGRGELGMSIKDLLRSNPENTFKPRDIAEALDTTGPAVSLWFNKYGMADSEIERVPSGKGGKRFVYRIK